jgi:biopolymer transport protein ExbD
MEYFKDDNGEVYAYDADQVAAGLADDKTLMTPEEVEAHKNPPKTAEQLREEWKAQRAAQVESITVTTDAGNTFDGDEISQGRMARAIIALDASAPGTTVNWVLADNTVIYATALELTEALALAGAAQAALWVAP